MLLMNDTLVVVLQGVLVVVNAHQQTQKYKGQSDLGSG